jgi:hypothetical protein
MSPAVAASFGTTVSLLGDGEQADNNSAANMEVESIIFMWFSSVD